MHNRVSYKISYISNVLIFESFRFHSKLRAVIEMNEELSKLANSSHSQIC